MVGERALIQIHIALVDQGSESFMNIRPTGPIGRVLVVKVSKCWNKGRFKFGGNLVKFFSPTSAFAEDVGEKDTEGGCDTSDNKTDDGITHFAIGALLGSLATGLVVCYS